MNDRTSHGTIWFGRRLVVMQTPQRKTPRAADVALPEFVALLLQEQGRCRSCPGLLAVPGLVIRDKCLFSVYGSRATNLVNPFGSDHLGFPSQYVRPED